MKTIKITTALITAALASSPVLANNSSATFDVDSAASNYEFQQTLAKLKDSVRSEISFERKATLAEKQRLSEVMLKESATAQVSKPRIHLISKPNLHQIK